MNRKIIDKIIRKRVSNWLLSIEDKILAKILKEEVIVTGGCIASLLLNEKVKDYDLYFTTKNTVKKLAEYYVNKFNQTNNTNAFILDGQYRAELMEEPGVLKKMAPELYDKNDAYISGIMRSLTEDRIRIIIPSAGVAAENDIILEQPVVETLEELDEIETAVLEDTEEKQPFRPVFLSPNAITLSDKIQLVIRFHGDAKKIHENYDFIHCTNYWTFAKRLVLNEQALESILTKNLLYTGSKYPLCSVIRTRKFIKRGYHINAGQYLKMLFQVSKLDLTNIDVLEDQLVGVDSAYFSILIQALRTKISSDKDYSIETNYLTSIIDKIF